MEMEREPDFRYDRAPQPAFNLNTGVSITVLIAVLGYGTWLGNQFSDVRTSFSKMEIQRITDNAEHAKDIAKLEVSISEARRETADSRREAVDRSSDRWTKRNMSHWSSRLQRTNNEAGVKILVPDPDDEKPE